MAVSRQEVLQVARLARLRLSPEEVERFTAQLNGILAHFDTLAAVDTAGVDGAGAVAEGRAPLRSEDVAPDGLAHPPSALAPAWEAGFFTVPRLAALDSPALDEPFRDKARADSAGRPAPEELDGAGA